MRIGCRSKRVLRCMARYLNRERGVQMNKEATFRSSALMLALAAYSVGALGDQPVGTIRNFGPNLQQTVCRQPEGIATDSRGRLYASSNSDTATIGHVCVFDRHATLA